MRYTLGCALCGERLQTVMYKIGWFSSGRGAGSRALLTTIAEGIVWGEIPAKIVFVFCNREPGHSEETDRFLDLVKSYDLPLVCFSSREFRARRPFDDMSTWRTNYDREVMRRLEGFQVDLCVLAGYMLIVGTEMCQEYTMINLHPAAPGGPKGTWREVIWQLIESRAERTGIMMHLVTPELDEGPPISYCTFSLRGKPFDEHWERLAREPLGEIRGSEGEEFALFKLIRQHGLKRELPLIVSTVKAFSEDRLRVEGRRIVDANGNSMPAYNLTTEIDRIVSA
ncbi:MAG: Phosphoribosylglycinamide formyltransferase [Chloroflexi bacterium]|nr:Phosphoribosylglycinamide formyltransferase [Chloroflexota bacterium]MBT9166181.1 Phosphoribosylglycinamide formyltransferase [Chloroflexota bacterium]